MLTISTLVLSSSCQRLFLEAVEGEMGHPLFWSLLMVIAMIAAVPFLAKMVPWPGTNMSWTQMLALACLEAAGTLLMSISLTEISASNQSIISRGCELLSVAIINMIWPRTLDKGIASTELAIVCLATCFSIVIPVWMEHDLWCLLILATRSACYGLLSVVEEVLMNNDAVSPSYILLHEAAGGGVVLLVPTMLLWALGVSAELPESFALVSASRFCTVGALVLLVATAVQTFTRLLVVRQYSALVYQLSGALIPAGVMILGSFFHAFIDVRMGESYTIAASVALVCSIATGFLANVLYTHWSCKHSALYLEGIQAQKEAGMAYPESDIERICLSGIENPSSSIGVYAHDKCDYTLMHPFFRAVATTYHRLDSFPEPRDCYVHELPKDAPFELSEFKWDRISVLRLRVARNIEGFPFPPGMTFDNRCTLLQTLRPIIMSFAISQCSVQCSVVQDWVEVPMSDVPEIWPVREYECMASAGLLNHWPNCRSVFKTCAAFHDACKAGYNTMTTVRSEKHTIELGVVVNEEDHLRFYATVTGPNTNSARVAHVLLAGLVSHLTNDARVKYSFVPDFGYLATCPSNIGTGYKISCRSHMGLTAASQRRLGISVPDIIKEARVAMQGDLAPEAQALLQQQAGA